VGGAGAGVGVGVADSEEKVVGRSVMSAQWLRISKFGPRKGGNAGGMPRSTQALLMLFSWVTTAS